MKKSLQVLIVCVVLFSCQNSNKTEMSNTTTDNNRNSELEESMKQGKEVYNNFCVSCHMVNGKGFSNTFPPLANSDYLMTKRIESIKAIKFGLSEAIVVNGETYTTPMTRLGLSNKEVADVMNYITNSWGNKNSSLITEKEVSKIKP